jgi:hypothetical protein
MAQPYPWRNGPGADWSTDEAWAILDEIPAGILPDEWRFWLGGKISAGMRRVRADAHAGKPCR